jgi:[acyl-carrier-protein] S-malonyltransferase
VFLELGPGDALARIARERFPELAIRSVADFRGVDGAAAWVGKNL